MGYKNCFSAAYEAERCLACGSYSVDSHGDLGAHYNSIANADLPRYTTMFYSLTPHENLAELKYDKVKIDYDKSLKEIRDAVQGAPIEAYIPQPVFMPDGIGGSDIAIREADVMPKKTIVDEILKAQAEILGKGRQAAVMIKATEIEQAITLRRRFRKIEIVRQEKTRDEDDS